MAVPREIQPSTSAMYLPNRPANKIRPAQKKKQSTKRQSKRDNKSNHKIDRYI